MPTCILALVVAVVPTSGINATDDIDAKVRTAYEEFNRKTRPFKDQFLAEFGKILQGIDDPDEAAPVVEARKAFLESGTIPGMSPDDSKEFVFQLSEARSHYREQVKPFANELIDRLKSCMSLSTRAGELDQARAVKKHIEYITDYYVNNTAENALVVGTELKGKYKYEDELKNWYITHFTLKIVERQGGFVKGTIAVSQNGAAPETMQFSGKLTPTLIKIASTHDDEMWSILKNANIKYLRHVDVITVPFRYQSRKPRRICEASWL